MVRELAPRHLQKRLRRTPGADLIARGCRRPILHYNSLIAACQFVQVWLCAA